MDLDEALAESALGILRPERLPEICTDALVSGLVSPSLAALAGEPAAILDPDASRSLFSKAIRELSLSLPSRRQAADLLVKRAIGRALAGQLTPYDALTRIVCEIYHATNWENLDQKSAGDSLCIETLVGLYWDYDDIGEPWMCSRSELDQEVLSAFSAHVNTLNGQADPLQKSG